MQMPHGYMTVMMVFVTNCFLSLGETLGRMPKKTVSAMVRVKMAISYAIATFLEFCLHNYHTYLLTSTLMPSHCTSSSNVVRYRQGAPGAW